MKAEDKPSTELTWEELAGAIDWEGGTAEYFFHRSLHGEYVDKHLEVLVMRAKEAYDNLHDYLEKKGGIL